LVIPQDDVDYCRENILSRLALRRKVNLVAGGVRRQDSVYNGLQQVDGSCRIVVIHDGVRPFVQPEQLRACIDGARESGACIMGMPANDTLKRVDRYGGIVNTIERDIVWMAQTPQAFQYDLIRSAHEQAQLDGFEGTDDASLVERLGKAVKILRGSRVNLKITNKEDLILAQALLEKAGLLDAARLPENPE
jgi:2-C-methyl-D-erythritol 4-phosphate cytidylyltransferase